MSEHGEHLKQELKHKPDREMAERILRLRNNPDFMEFANAYFRDRGAMLAFMACNPMLDQRMATFMQGRVHELVDLRSLIQNIDKTVNDFKKPQSGGGVVT